MRFNCNKWTWFLGAGLGLAVGGLASAQGVLNVYASRHYGADRELNERFTKLTGIEVKVQSAEADPLIERLKSEGESSPADVFITVDVARLQNMKKAGLLQPVKSAVIEERVPAEFRDAEGYWTPYTVRARIIVASVERVKPGEISTYEDLADPKWAGRLLIRSSTSTYNQSLLASMIAANGPEAAQAWANAVVKNLARPPQGGDRDQIKGVAAGLADVAVTNTYYLGLLLNSADPADREAAAKVRPIFPNQDGRGAHFNVSGVAVLKHARNVDAAVKYIEFLLSPESQQYLANATYEFPVRLDPPLSTTHESWGVFKLDTKGFPKLGENLETAFKTADRAGWK